MLNEEQCAQLLDETLVASVESFDELASTNDHAIECSRQGDAELPLLVLAGRQVAGRGRGTNTWWSSPGALTFSLLLGQRHLSATGYTSPLASLAVGVAVCDALAAIDGTLDVGVKWPNDVYVAGRKIAGILMECPSSMVGDVVVGIGINVNNSIRTAPEEIAARATSLTDLLSQDCDSYAILSLVLQQIEYQFSQLQADPARIVQRCCELCVLTGRRITVSLGGRQVTGECQGIAASGALIVQSDHERLECLAGQIDAID